MVNSDNKRQVKNYIKYCLCFFIIYLLFSCSSTPEQLLSEGLYYHGRGHYDKAIAIYKEVIKDAPTLHTQDSDNRSVLGLLALSYAYSMEADSAIKVAKQALEKDPNDWVALGALGVSQILKKDFAKAKENLNKAISNKPGAWHAYNWLASIYLIEKDIENAESTLEESIDMNPENHLARSWIIVIESLKGNQQNAIKEFKQTIFSMKIIDTLAMFKYDDHINLLYSSLNSIFKGDSEAATLQLNKYVKEKPLQGGNFLLGVIYLLKKDKTYAIENFKKEAEGKGPFCFLSNIWLEALYAYDGDINSFLKANSIMPRCF